MIRYLRTFFLALIAVAMTATRLPAASSLPPALEHASEEEKARYLEEQGKLSLEEKRVVGWQRYNERLALRQALAGNMQSNFEQRSETILSRFTAPPEPVAAASPQSSRYQTWILWTGIFVFAAIFIYHRYFEKRPVDHYTVVGFRNPPAKFGEPKTYDLDQAA